MRLRNPLPVQVFHVKSLIEVRNLGQANAAVIQIPYMQMPAKHGPEQPVLA
jgi:hypothetical protein